MRASGARFLCMYIKYNIGHPIMNSPLSSFANLPRSTCWNGCAMVTLLVVFVAGGACAANFTTAIQQGSATPPNNWYTNNNGVGIWQPGNVAPTAGNTYECIAW